MLIGGEFLSDAALLDSQPPILNSQRLIQQLTLRRVLTNYTPSLFTIMGKQYNKVEKRRRRSNYLARRKAKAASKGGVARAKRPAKKKAAASA